MLPSVLQEAAKHTASRLTRLTLAPVPEARAAAGRRFVARLNASSGWGYGRPFTRARASPKVQP